MAQKSGQTNALIFSTLAFTTCFAVWTIFSIIGVKIKEDLGLSGFQFGLLAGTPILTGSLIRLMVGVWSEQYGSRRVFVILMIASAIATYFLSLATTYPMMLLAALGLGVAGGTFIVGIVYVAHWFPQEKQGTAMGVFGMGNGGAAVTKLLAPTVMASVGWQGVAQIWSAALLVMALIFWFSTKEDPTLAERRARGEKPESMKKHLEPLKNIQVWRFSLYYVFVFGAFVGLALWMPMYYTKVYGLDLKVAGMLAAMFSVAGSVFRGTGGWLSDRHGPRKVMYWTFAASLACLFFLSYPPTEYVVHGVDGDIRFSFAWSVVPFTMIIFTLGFFMAIGKAAVYKHIANYYPNNVGSVGGIVGLIGGLGGFFLPMLFGLANDYIGIWTSCFMILYALAGASLLWMHISIRKLEHKMHPTLKEHKYLGEFSYSSKKH
ncbi:MAG: NarK/NasA family nitrate transporter [Alphaproteobacteria bacterium]|nr:NarK/NasA family nitrate transporter [Alphaproteobacteria bacterium]